MKTILGLDLGTNSIGWALVKEAENKEEKSSIVKLGVRVNPLTVDEQRNFEQGKSITTNADRTLKRSMRRSLQRYKLRRDNLIEVLENNKLLSDKSLLLETGNNTTFQTYKIRAKAASEEVTLDELSRVLLMINKKRGYKSNRKAKSSDEGQLIDGMDVAVQLYENDLTPGQFVYQRLLEGKRYIPDFYRSDLVAEFDKIWNSQKQFYPEYLTEQLKEELKNRNEKQTWAICAKPFTLVGIKREAKGEELKKENYEWRVKSLSEKLNLEQLAIVFQKINSQINASSGYLGAIGDRSKELYFNKQTVGQYLMSELSINPHFSVKNKVFYRQDYLDEFERIWETQSRFHHELTTDLKKLIRDIIIFYQRPLKSQKGTLSFCEFENRQIEVVNDGNKKTMTIGLHVCPKSSPLFQEFKIWQILNNIQVIEKATKASRFLNQDEKDILFSELNIKEKIAKADALKLLYANYKDLDLNYKEIDGNRTQAALFKIYQSIIELSGHGEYDFAKMDTNAVMNIVKSVFVAMNWNSEILTFDSSIEGEAFEQQPAYRLWHLLYSFEGDNSKTGNEKMVQKITSLFGFEEEYAKQFSNIIFQPEYGSLSAKAIRKILPYLKDGHDYSVACEYAGYRHSKRSLTREELAQKTYKEKLDLLPRNSLRNPVVEKILNQMINVVNQIVNQYGKPDEIRIELARELKKSAKEREELSNVINKATAENIKYKEVLEKEFGLNNVSRNDILRYRLYLELKNNNFRTLYTNTYIPQEKLFSKEFDIEHIIPQAKLFDDSFSNKTLEETTANREKSNSTAFDYIHEKFGEKAADEYTARVESLFEEGVISKTKRNKLLMKEADIPNGFIDRDLRNSQYIAKKAREILEEMVAFVVPTTGAITDRLREDWQLVDVMKELNWDKYEKIGATEVISDKDGRRIPRIKDWTKRNDHRHHAMDALTIAFTKRSIIQYLNNLNARVQKGVDDYVYTGDLELCNIPFNERSKIIYCIEKNELYRDSRNKLKFIPPMPLNEFRAEAKRQLDDTLISIKAKNKVVTHNVNETKRHGGTNIRIQLTPRGQLHNETIYGSSKKYVSRIEKIGASFDAEKITKVACKKYRIGLQKRLNQFGGDPKKAFTGKNSLDKSPIFIDEQHTHQIPDKVKVVYVETIYTIRKPISSDLRLEKVVDTNIRKILQLRLDEYGGDARKAFSNLSENPIWLNKEKGIDIKRVTITGVANAIPLHSKTCSNGEKIPIDFVSTSNNHHVAIYRDANGDLQENVVSFYEATMRANLGLPIIDKEYRQQDGWVFLFSMKQNEYFVFPNKETGFDPNEINLLNPANYAMISPNLFRVQRISNRDYVFRHHLETTVDYKNTLTGITWRRCGLSGIEGIQKVRVNHLGIIVMLGE